MIIYKTTNLINSKIYIGKTSTDNVKYLGSGILIQSAIKKYGVHNFIRETIDTVLSAKELDEREIYWIKFYRSCDREIGYNLSTGGQGGSNYGNIKIAKKISKSLSGKKRESFSGWTPEVKERWIKALSFAHRGFKHSIETIQKISEGNRNKKCSDETRLKIGIKSKGRKFSEDAKIKMRKPHKAFSEETKLKMSNSRIGMKHSSETIEKLKRSKSSEHKIKISEAKKTYYMFYKNDVLIHIVHGQLEAINFCKLSDLPYSVLLKRKLYKEWKIIQKTKEM